MNWDNHYGAGISEDTRNRWANEIKENLEKNPDQEFHYVWSGNSFVIGCRVGGEIQIFDTVVVRSIGESK